MKLLLRRKLPLILIAVATLVTVISEIREYSIAQGNLNTIKQAELRSIVDQLEAVIQQKEKLAAAQATLIAGLPNVQAAFRNGDRRYLQAYLTPNFLKQKTLFGIFEMTFATPPARLFLKLSNPALYGEDLSGFRFMLVATNMTRSSHQGIEPCREGIAVHGVVPVVDAHGLIGSLSVGINIKDVMEQIKEMSKVEIGGVIEQNIYNVVDSHKETTNSFNTVGTYHYTYSTHRNLIHGIAAQHGFSQAPDQIQEFSLEGVKYSSVMVPIHNFQNLRVGFFILAKSFSEIETIFYRTFIWECVLELFKLIIIAGAVLLVFNGMLASPLLSLVRRCQQISSGQKGSLEDFCNRKDEVGKLARAFDKIVKAQGLDTAADEHG